VDIRGDSNEKMTLKTAIFGAFAHYIFRTLKYKPQLLYSNIQLLNGFTMTSNYMTSNDLEWPFCVKIVRQPKGCYVLIVFCLALK